MPLTTPSDRLAEALKDRYTLERELGRGGMATVYLAEDRRHDLGREGATCVEQEEVQGGVRAH